MTLTIRPITAWPGELRNHQQRIRSPFSSTYSNTLVDLDRELRMLRATVTVVQLAVNEGQIRRDGKLRASAYPDHPGVILSFDTKQGHFRYACDRFTSWQDNLRAIALGLEALRKIARYGIGSGTEQYTGFLQIEPPRAMTYDEALQLFATLTGEDPRNLVLFWWQLRSRYWRTASKAAHPDTGGDPDTFARAKDALRIIDKELS